MGEHGSEKNCNLAYFTQLIKMERTDRKSRNGTKWADLNRLNLVFDIKKQISRFYLTL